MTIYMTIKEELKIIIQEQIAKKAIDFQILETEREEFGDYSTNVTFILAKKLGKSPKDIAEELKNKLLSRKDVFKTVEIAGNGFVNLFLSNDYLINKLKEIKENKEGYGKIQREKPEKIQVEFISANPTGLLHLGHGRNGFYGDTLARVLEYAGYNVQREFYVNDAQESTQIKEAGKTAKGEGEQYKTQDFIDTVAKLKKELKGKEYGEAGRVIANHYLERFRSFLASINIKIDNYFSEQTLYENKKKEELLEYFKKERLSYEKDGALWLKTSEFGDEKDRVIVRKTGDTTYFLSDILYHQNKIDRGFDRIINIWGADHQGHEKRMQAVMRILKYQGVLEIPIIQMLRLQTKEGPQKMSKRAGTVVDLEWLVNHVGSDVVRFLMISSDIKSQMVFDLELAKEKSEKNPVFYVQYALVRCYSVLRNAQEIINKDSTKDAELLKKDEELALIKQMVKFPDLILGIAENHEVHHLITYATSLAKRIHQFYKNCHIIDEKEPKTTQARLLLVETAKSVLERLFDVIGIEKIEKM